MTDVSLAGNKATTFDVSAVRKDFPILSTSVNGNKLVYLDNAATSQKPQCVIDAIDDYYRTTNANIHRGVHMLSEKATDAFEAARRKVQHFINAKRDSEIIFCRGTTEAINLVASSYGRANISAGDEVLITYMEHHSNIVPWQLLCEQTGATLKVVPINERGELILEEYERLLTAKTKLVALTHISNALGTINPVKDIIKLAHANNTPVLIDGAQAAPHTTIDVQNLDCDFYTLSGHKMYGPTGIGVLYGKQALLEAMPPYQGGGEMIRQVSFTGTTYNVPPFKFEAGTMHIAGAIGLGVAIDYLQQLGMDNIAAYEHHLLAYATRQAEADADFHMIGTAKDKASILSFTYGDVHAHDLGTILDHQGVAIRTGHHCAMPVMEFYNVPATARASFAFYNTTDEIDALFAALIDAKKVFG
ncbi:MAG: cysteine desulfurase CsdA [Legionellales bacterium]|nr:cysteine desulfurase CsdA [Legionellales bacterium]|tara:strand:+ start:30774 stop:32027 length:1254 start_codon:yes stop_codon:yes gene_type:complete